MTSRLRLVAAAALTLAVLPLGATASAETWSHRDATRDVLTVSDDAEGPGRRDPGNKDADIRSVSVRHATKKVTVTLRLRDLRGGDSMLLGFLQTPDEHYVLQALRSSDFSMLVLFTENNDPEERPCRAKRLRRDLAQDVIRITVPRSCVGDPAWVRFGATYVTGDLTSVSDDAQPIHVDDALREGGRLAALGNPALSPKVRVG